MRGIILGILLCITFLAGATNYPPTYYIPAGGQTVPSLDYFSLANQTFYVTTSGAVNLASNTYTLTYATLPGANTTWNVIFDASQLTLAAGSQVNLFGETPLVKYPYATYFYINFSVVWNAGVPLKKVTYLNTYPASFDSLKITGASTNTAATPAGLDPIGRLVRIGYNCDSIMRCITFPTWGLQAVHNANAVMNRPDSVNTSHTYRIGDATRYISVDSATGIIIKFPGTGNKVNFDVNGMTLFSAYNFPFSNPAITGDNYAYTNDGSGVGAWTKMLSPTDTTSTLATIGFVRRLIGTTLTNQTTFTPLTGDSITVTTPSNVITPAGTIANLTIVVPGSPTSGQILEFTFDQVVTSIHWSMTANQSNNVGAGVPGTAAAIGTTIKLQFNSATSKWKNW